MYRYTLWCADVKTYSILTFTFHVYPAVCWKDIIQSHDLRVVRQDARKAPPPMSNVAVYWPFSCSVLFLLKGAVPTTPSTKLECWGDTHAPAATARWASAECGGRVVWGMTEGEKKMEYCCWHWMRQALNSCDIWDTCSFKMFSSCSHKEHCDG